MQKPTGNGNETPETTAVKMLLHLFSAFKLSMEEATSILFEHVHRSPGSSMHGKIRNILAKSTYFKDREMDMNRRKHQRYIMPRLRATPSSGLQQKKHN
ncbi:hypothetical protein DPMN_041501 [Dreissena polymorpha]|uniref:Uncharacterized protein n=1 Tax=Dreissena polymorpha TaxID=45954 RepID=A0A9D4HXY3_DREPO|nr:hypothetical protein DPMN_041501 [Dreissena polymorpha]